jgi:hypothetical protein
VARLKLVAQHQGENGADDSHDQAPQEGVPQPRLVDGEPERELLADPPVSQKRAMLMTRVNGRVSRIRDR